MNSDSPDAASEESTGFEGLGQKHWKSDRVKDLERQGRDTPRPGYVQVYTGDGKGKTTAALGLIARAAGYGHRSCLISFMKGDPNFGELRFIRDRMEDVVDWHLAGRMSFVDPENPDAEDIAVAQDGFNKAMDAVASGDYFVVVLDEINVALTLGLVKLPELLKLIDGRPDHVEIVCTGRDAPQELCDRADLVTEMKMHKHFYDADIPARRGIEF